jgi:hypothetical protein
MNTKKYFVLSSICVLGGVLLYAIAHDWIIINRSLTTSYSHTQSTYIPKTVEKKVTLFFWHQGSWHQEATQLVWHEQQSLNIAYLINSWLSLLDDEKIINKKISVQTAMFNDKGTELYISFDHALFCKEATTHEKWLLIEGLLKTLRENGITVPVVRFLTNHQSMIDAHLDFNSPWPIQGFIA